MPLFMIFSFILLVSFSSLAQSKGQGAIIANNIIIVFISNYYHFVGHCGAFLRAKMANLVG